MNPSQPTIPKTRLDPLYEGGLLLVDKPKGISSFGAIEKIQHALIKALNVRKKDAPKMGHGGTLDPFATGLLPICIGGGVKLSRYFLESNKEYTGTIVFGASTLSGDLTDPIHERTQTVPEDLGEVQKAADQFVGKPYSQTPPMHSAKKVGGKPLYELARQGIEIERAPRICQIEKFQILSLHKKDDAIQATFLVRCSAGTYIRTLAQDLARSMGSLAFLSELRRTQTGSKRIEKSESLERICERITSGQFENDVASFIPFHQMLEGFDSISVSDAEAWAITRGQQDVLVEIVKRKDSVWPKRQWQDQEMIVLKKENQRLLAVLRFEKNQWGLERVLCTD
ncbi:MAG: tRNA pseudouridine(55) synthase TruB [Bdellovibrionales bacterium]|nr:tRNA pseudouridine(55) synthase TruB [Bdellovibrionales bacterium]